MTIIVRTSSPSSTGVRINSQNQQKVRTLAAISSTSLVGLNDVSVIENTNNSILVYNTNTSKYEIKALPVVFGGTF
jgi:hypothetical protein